MSPVTANDNDRDSYAPVSSGSGSGGGCSRRITRATNAATACGDSCPHNCGQLPDHRGHLVGLQRADVAGDRVHMIGGDDPGRPRRRQGRVLGGQRPRPGQPAGLRHQPTAGHPAPPPDPPTAGCPPPWRRASGGPTRTPPPRTPRPTPPHPPSDAPRPTGPSPAGPHQPPRWPAPTGRPPPATPTPAHPPPADRPPCAGPLSCCSPQPPIARTPVRTLSRVADNTRGHEPTCGRPQGTHNRLTQVRAWRHSPVTSQRIRSTSLSGLPRWPSAASTTTMAPGTLRPSQAPWAAGTSTSRAP